LSSTLLTLLVLPAIYLVFGSKSTPSVEPPATACESGSTVEPEVDQGPAQ
jgi:hypothetical protein